MNNSSDSEAENKGNEELIDENEISNEKDAALQYLFGAQLRKVRKEFFGNASQRKLGSKIFDKYPQNTMYQLEQGKGSVNNILKLLSFYHENGINLNFLFSEHADNSQMIRFNLTPGDSLFAQSVIDKYENAIRNLLKAQDFMSLMIEKNINDFQKNIQSISTLTTVESIDINKSDKED